MDSDLRSTFPSTLFPKVEGQLIISTLKVSTYLLKFSIDRKFNLKFFRFMEGKIGRNINDTRKASLGNTFDPNQRSILAFKT